jgi:oligopeptide transport system permease protein
MHLAPGGPFTKERQMPPEIERRLLAEYKLDLPIHEQLGHYLAGLARGDLGPSMTYKDKDVVDMIAEGAPTSAILGFSAMALRCLSAAALGVMAALGRTRCRITP